MAVFGSCAMFLLIFSHLAVPTSAFVQQGPDSGQIDYNSEEFIHPSLLSANFNETCDLVINNDHHGSCLASKNLICDQHHICRCIRGEPGGATTFVHNPRKEGCEPVPVAVAAQGYVCEWDEQCTASAMGLLSKCMQGKCVYADPGDPEVETGVYKEKCYRVKYFGDLCESSVECALGDVNSSCERHESYKDERVCQCAKGSTCGNEGGGGLPVELPNSLNSGNNLSLKYFSVIPLMILILSEIMCFC